jgi:hypothetical protein
LLGNVKQGWDLQKSWGFIEKISNGNLRVGWKSEDILKKM